jgi:hypothetical protein
MIKIEEFKTETHKIIIMGDKETKGKSFAHAICIPLKENING